MDGLVITGLLFSFTGSLLLIIYGVAFKGDDIGAYTGRSWWKWFSNGVGQRLGFICLTLGFLLQLIGQLVSG
jgi:hypothetical protein